MDDRATPQTILVLADGYSDPFDVCMPSTNLAESADVMKNEDTRMIAKIDNGILSGNSLKIANSCVSGPKLNISGVRLATSIPVTPNTVNQMIPIVVAKINSAITNSHTGRPQDNGA